MKKTASTAKKAGGGVQQTLSAFFSKSPSAPSKSNGATAAPAHANGEKGQPVKSPPVLAKQSSSADQEVPKSPASTQKSQASTQKAQASTQKKQREEEPDVVEMEVDAPQARKRRIVAAESSDEEVPVRRVRNKVSRSMREPSSEEDEEIPEAIESDDLSEEKSSHTTPAKSEKIEKKSVSKLPAIPLGKLPLQNGAQQKASKKRSEPEALPASNLSEKEEKKRHEKFVKKVSLFRERQLEKAADSKSKEKDSEDGFLAPCDLSYPRGAKLTPFEAQVVEIKKKHPDTVLLVECGYKMRFLGRDAEIAAKILNIFHHIDHNFPTASIPVFRLQIHLRRLVEAGYKVGVVRQMETAALKAVSDSKSKAFQRQLCEVYTKSTMLVEDVDVLGQHTHITGGSGAGSGAAYMMCVCEDTSSAIEVDSPKEGESGDQRVLMGMVCVDTASGDIVYDEFEDGPTRSELESRVSHLQPRELVLPEGLSSATSKLLRRVFGQGASSSARVETIPTTRFQPENAKKAIQKFFQEQQQEDQEQSADDGAEHDPSNEMGCVGEGRIGGMGMDSVMKLPTATLSCLAGLLSYLKEFKLDQVLRLTSNFWRFTSPSHMMLDASVMSNLEVLCNQNDGTEHGSLIWLLKNTRTAFGSRLLRHWVTHPLVDRERIVARHDAVEELMSDPVAVEPLANHLKGLPDLERALARVHYGKCAPNELVAVLKAFQKVSVLGRQAKASADDLQSALLTTIIGAMPDVSARLDGFLDEIDQKAACATTGSGNPAPDKHNLLKGYRSRAEYPKIAELKHNVKKVEGELEEHMVHCRRLLGMPNLEYKTVAQTEYLIEVPVSKINKVPRDWDKINATKAASRYQSPEVRELLAERARTHEQLDAQTAVAWQQFQNRVADCYGELRSMVQRLAVLDALMSLAVVSKRGGWCRPEMVEEHELTITQGRHPMVDQLLASGFVPNDIGLHQDGQTAMIITGPNMGGKSSYIRQNALIVIMAQIGCFVPADDVKMGVFDNVYTRMGAQDFIAKGQSTFLVELQEASDVLRRATSRSLVIMDELGRGTSTHDGTAIAYASLKALVEDIKCFTLFVTHYQFICQMQDELPDKIQNHHMSFMEDGKDKIAFMYRLVKGSAQRSFGLNVALLARLPQAIVDRASCKSKELEDKVSKRLVAHAGKMVGNVCRLADTEEPSDEVLAKLKQAVKDARRLVRTQELA